jgi:hypothetical protein
MNEQCIKLRDTFDTRYIKENKDLFYKISKENVNSGKGNNTLMRLIINEKEYSQDRAKMCEFIKGPSTLSMHYNKETNKTIYIFGENHVVDDTCEVDKSISLGINEFLVELMYKTNVFLDIYIEVRIDDIYNSAIDSRQKLYLLYDKFKKCIKPESRDNLEVCKLGRFHYTDIRHDIDIGKIDVRLIRKEPFSPDEMNILIQKDGYLYKLLSEISNCKTKNEIKDFINKDFESKISSKLLQKEISKCIYGKEIVDFFHKASMRDIENEFSLYQKMVDLCSKILRNIKDVDDLQNYPSEIVYQLSQILINLQWFAHYYSVVSFYIMDIYLLCRIFRKFKPTENKPSEQCNIIIYAGNFHSELYREFLETMNFKMEKYTENLKPFKNCVNVKDFLPLFE